jgi:hypothetical protein
LRPALFEEHSSADAPLLLSLPFLLHCRATLCLDEQRGLRLVNIWVSVYHVIWALREL